LSEDGVPDDEMSDSLPPYGGPDPYGGWDLEGLLSGENVWLPEAMGPVAGTLSALCAPPTATELTGESAARAMFRQAMASAGSGPAGPGSGLAWPGGEPGRPGSELGRVGAVAWQDGAAWSGSAAADAHTLIRPDRAADDAARAATRPRHSHRRPPRYPRWRSKALVGAAAAAVVIVGGVVLGGMLSGSGGQPGPSAHGSGATSASTQANGKGSGSTGLEGKATAEPSPTPSHSAAGAQGSSAGSGGGAGAAELCRQYWEFISRPESRASWRAENGNLQVLSGQAGGLWNVNRYCAPYAPQSSGPQGPGSGPGAYPGDPDFQAPGDGQDAQESQGSKGKSWPVPHNGPGGGSAGAGGNEGGPGGNGPGAKGPAMGRSFRP
jgi:hypothetical protein